MPPLSPAEKRQWVIAELQSAGPARLGFLPHHLSQGHGNVLIRCPFHKGGQERTPSLSVKLDAQGSGTAGPGAWACFGCAAEKNFTGSGGGTWNNLAPALGLAPFPQSQGSRQGNFGSGNGSGDGYAWLPPASFLEGARAAWEAQQQQQDAAPAHAQVQNADQSEGTRTTTPKPPETPGLEPYPPYPLEEPNNGFLDYTKFPLFPKELEWRGIQGTLLAKVDARTVRKETRSGALLKKLYLPVMVCGEQRSGIFCDYKKNPRYPSYLYEKGPGPSQSLYPFDYVAEALRKMPASERYVILVEGPRDALTLLQEGLPALALLGALKAWNPRKLDLVLSLGAPRVILAPDPDEAGTAFGRQAMADFQDSGMGATWFKMKARRVPLSGDGGRHNNKNNPPVKIQKIEDPGALTDASWARLREIAPALPALTLTPGLKSA